MCMPAASADWRRLVDSAVISKSSRSDFKAGMCACAAHPRSGLAPMMPTRILLAPGAERSFILENVSRVFIIFYCWITVESFRFSRPLHKYPGEVLAMCIEDNQPEEC